MFQFKLDRKRKYLLLALGGLLFLGLVYRFYPSFREALFPKAEIALKERMIVKYQKQINADSGVAQSVKILKNALEKAEEGLLAGKTPSLAAVRIQDILQEITRNSGVVIRRLQVLKPEALDNHPYLSVPVEFYLYCTITQLKDVLYKIGVFQKYLTVRKVTIHYTRRNVEGSIRCQITVAGYMKTTKG